VVNSEIWGRDLGLWKNELVKFKEKRLSLKSRGAKTPIELDNVRVRYLGRAGLISKLSESMREVS